MFVAPSKTKNPFLFTLEIIFPIIAACPLPNPGKKLHRGAAIVAPISGFTRDGLGIFRDCFGIFGLFFIDNSSVEDPNKPVNNGNKDCSSSRLKTINPRIPVIAKTRSAFSFDFSKVINNTEIKIKI